MGILLLIFPLIAGLGPTTCRLRRRRPRLRFAGLTKHVSMEIHPGAFVLAVSSTFPGIVEVSLMPGNVDLVSISHSESQ